LAPRQPYKQKERQWRENEIVQQARQIMLERGYVSLNMDDLAERVGISKPTLYQHFKSKEDIAARVILRDFEATRAQFQQPQEGTALEKLTINLRWLLKTRYTQGNAISNFGYEVISIFHANTELRAHREQSILAFHELVDAAKAQGEINTELPTPLVVQAMFCLLGILNNPFHQAFPALTESELDLTIERIINMFLTGIIATQ
jgi:AcrR family transcriptional regulator